MKRDSDRRKTLDPRPEQVYFFKGLVAVPTADDVQQVRTADRLGLWTVNDVTRVGIVQASPERGVHLKK